MKVDVVWQLDAQDDLDQAALTYQAEDEYLALRFLSAVEASVELLRTYPESAPKLFDETRSLPIPKFPYSVLYVLTESRIVVIAIAHQHRRPGFWRGRSSLD